MKKLVLILIIGVAAYSLLQKAPNSFSSVSCFSSSGDRAIQDAYRNRQSDIQLGGSGKVIRILPDDNQGSRHQRFIIELHSGQTLLISHNIDIAPRISALTVGDHISFHGEYEWNNKGGVVHWTHHDPNGFHEGGWLRRAGKTYE